jgi:dienelactone hydrolase
MNVLAAAILATAVQAGGDPLDGHWQGVLKAPGAELEIRLRFSSKDGRRSGAMDIPQQGGMGIPLEELTLEKGTVRFILAKVPGNPTFDGDLKGDVITGTLSQGGAKIPFELKRGKPPARPQDPKAPFPYAAEEVKVASGALKLAGTLTTPEGKGPFPVVVLITGSGPQNRDEELFDHRPFAVLADHLSRAGIAVLRCDDRGVGSSEGDYAKAQAADFVGDVEACVAFLKGRPGVGPIGLVGHSQGSEYAAAVAARSKDVSFVVSLAGMGVQGKDLLVEQNRLVTLSMGATREEADLVAARADDLFSAILKKAPAADLKAKLLALAEAQVRGQVPKEELEAGLEKEVQGLTEPAFDHLLRHDPRPDYRKITVPVLALNGTKDVQVSADQNLPEIAKALKEAGNADVTTRKLEELNHAFQKCTTGSPAEYAQIDQTMDPTLLDLVRDWIRERFVKAK